MVTESFWESMELVDQFAGRAPDHRLEPLMTSYPNPATTQVLDLGCAGGRNTVLLAQQGYQVWAIDSSHAMITRTRERLARVIGEAQARQRVRHGSMDNLSVFDDSYFALIVALGIFHNARSWDEWCRSIAEATRVLAPGGRMLVNQFTPEVSQNGAITPVPGSLHLYDGLPQGRSVLLNAAELDQLLSAFGLECEVPSETVRVRTEIGHRVSVNALYRKRSDDP